jgi:dihydropteroate synthase
MRFRELKSRTLSQFRADPCAVGDSSTKEFAVGAALFSQDRVTVLGVLNVTPDSFSDGGRFVAPAAGEVALNLEGAVEAGCAMARAGAHVIDIGGESTRPGSEEISASIEIKRTLPVIESLAKKFSEPEFANMENAPVISIDTQKAEVAEAALRAGASVVNDVSGLNHDPKLARVAADAEAWLILGHMRGNPKTMQDAPNFKDVLREVADELQQSVEQAVRAGVSRERIVIDPGLGFGKTADDTYRLLANLDVLRSQLQLPLLMGASRKSFLAAVTGAPVDSRDAASHAADAIAVFLGAEAIRVHDVQGAVQVAAVGKALRTAALERPKKGGE